MSFKGPSERFREEPEQLPTFTSGDFALALENYIEAGTAQHTLRPRQLTVFHDFLDFFQQDQQRGFVQMPTGTGKTVLFVELTKALLGARNENGDEPRILVVDPLKDLVYQTLGTKKIRGFGRFAPDLKIGTFFSDSSHIEKNQIIDKQVVLTTYRSLYLMHALDIMRDQTPQERDEYWRALVSDTVDKGGASFLSFNQYFNDLHEQMRSREKVITGNKLLDLFNVIILDEAHHAMEPRAQEVLRSIAPNVPITGFTATPDADKTKRLKNYLPHKIHHFQLTDAIDTEVLAPLIPLGVASNVEAEREDLVYDSEGEYDDVSLSHLARSEKRNKLIVTAAEVLIEHGIGVIINTVRGQRAWHARHIAELLRERGVPVEAIYDALPASQRIDLYDAFEAGELSGLTYYGILGEGWDSNRAKGLINGRPTRSWIVGEQRIGRILRPGEPAFALDVVDRQLSPNYPVRIADIFSERAIKLGDHIGRLTSRESRHVNEVLEHLAGRLTLMKALPAEYHLFEDIAGQYASIKDGALQIHGGNYRLATQLNRRVVGANDYMLQEVAKQMNVKLDTTLGSMNQALRRVYNADQVIDLIEKLPITDPQQFYEDGEGSWATPEGVGILFKSLYPDLKPALAQALLNDAAPELKRQILRSVAVQNGWAGEKTKLHQAYLVDDYFISTAREILSQYYGHDGGKH
jgi:superfamily II DNA or RNA helicase